ncbi:hypothetical protein [Microbacterium sp. 22242]|uniref:hypothetical protein n=1 Tax=Microbacterium sp. 22242 TaxID=3453896 RepID=UPI003F867C2B
MGAPLMPVRGSRLKVTLPSTIAAILGCCYALVLLGVVVFLLTAMITHQGTIGHLTGTARRGPLVVSALLLLGAVDLAIGAVLVWRGRRGFLIMVPMGILFVVGSIGEVLDIANGSSLAGNLIGGGILLLAVIPVILLLLPRTTQPPRILPRSGRPPVHQ